MPSFIPKLACSPSFLTMTLLSCQLYYDNHCIYFFFLNFCYRIFLMHDAIHVERFQIQLTWTLEWVMSQNAHLTWYKLLCLLFFIFYFLVVLLLACCVCSIASNTVTLPFPSSLIYKNPKLTLFFFSSHTPSVRHIYELLGGSVSKEEHHILLLIMLGSKTLWAFTWEETSLLL